MPGGSVPQVATSEYVLEELSGAWKRLASRHRQSPADLNDFLDLVRLRCDMAPVDAAALALAQASGLRDPDDAPILAMLIGAKADFLVTGDKDLLALAGVYPILTPAAFEARFAP